MKKNKIQPKAAKTVKKSAKKNNSENKLIPVTTQLVTTAYTREERASVRMLKAKEVERLTGINRAAVQKFIDGRVMNIETVRKLAHIIEVLKEL